jgi:hypothetical protein
MVCLLQRAISHARASIFSSASGSSGRSRLSAARSAISFPDTRDKIQLADCCLTIREIGFVYFSFRTFTHARRSLNAIHALSVLRSRGLGVCVRSMKAYRAC